MYRGSKKRKTDDNGVRGPNSALTQFLREQGINAEEIRKKWEESRKDHGESVDATEANDGNTEEAKLQNDESLALSSSTESDDNLSVPSRREVLRKQRLVDSDEEEYDSSASNLTRAVSVGKESPADVEGLVCKRKKILEQRKRKRKKAADLLDRKTQRVTPLQDMCTLVISENIKKFNLENKTLDQNIRNKLGGISLANLNKLASALSKNRALNDNTLELFLKTELMDLTFYDCSQISFDGYKQLAMFSPHLKKLSLQMCGQLNNEALLYLADKLLKLEELYLDGPFLINEHTWNIFFEKMSNRLKAFHVSNTHRFTDNNLQSLLQNCGGTLQSLKLSRLDCVNAYHLLPQYLQNSSFHTLIIQYPANEGDVNDALIASILCIVGSHLEVLNLDGCSGLTEEVMINAFTPFLRNQNLPSQLVSLSIEELENITSDAFLFFFTSVPLPKLKYLNLRRCWNLDDAAITEIWLNSCAKTLERINLNSLKRLTYNAFNLMCCPNLRHLNVGFVRAVNDEVITSLTMNNPCLEVLEVYGDNQVTQAARVRSSVTIIGRQSDSI